MTDDKADRPKLVRDFPGWEFAERRAKKQFQALPDYAYEYAGNFPAESVPNGEVDAATAFRLAKLWWDTADLEVLTEAETESVRREMEAAYGEKWKRPPDGDRNR